MQYNSEANSSEEVKSPPGLSSEDTCTQNPASLWGNVNRPHVLMQAENCSAMGRSQYSISFNVCESGSRLLYITAFCLSSEGSRSMPSVLPATVNSGPRETERDNKYCYDLYQWFSVCGLWPVWQIFISKNIFIAIHNNRKIAVMK